MSTALVLSAIVCTRNRVDWSPKAVASLLAQDVGPERLEIVVVDNASTDDTAAALTSLVEGRSNARYVFEPELGLSRARNRGIAETSGEVVAFLDDDAEAVPSWARHHLDAFAADPATAGTGGRIDLDWPDDRPAWLSSQWDGMYAGLDLGDAPRELVQPAIPYGANMAVRRGALGDDPGFAVNLGRRGDDLTSGEERELFERLRSAGGKIMYLPDARVTHHVLPGRQDRDWFLRRVRAQGRTNVLLADILRPPRSRLDWLARAGYEASRAAATASRWALRSVARHDASARMDALGMTVQRAATARASLQMALRTPAATGRPSSTDQSA